MTLSKEEDWKKEIKGLLKPIEDSLGKMSSDLNEHLKAHQRNPPSPEGGSDKMPLLKCKGKDCGYQTESIEDYVEHRLHEVLPKPETTETTEEPKRHKSVDDFLNCPECFPKFEEAFIKRGYTKPQEKKPEEKKKGLAGLNV